MPIPGDPYWESVTALLHADATIGTNTTTDVSISPKTVTGVGSAVISTTQFMFGGASIYAPNTGSYFTITDGAGGALGSLNFTIECWVRFSSTASGLATCFDINNSAGAYGGIHMTPSGIYGSTTGASWNIAPAGGLNLANNTWQHVAVVRNGTSVLLWVGGTQRAAYTIGASETFDFAGTHGLLYVGSNNASPGECYVDEFRFTRGVARYTTAFTPEGPFPDGSSVTGVNTSGSTLEAVSLDTSFVTPGDPRARSLVKTVIIGTTTQAHTFSVEAVSRDTSFVMPGDLRARSVAKEVLLGPTLTVNSFLLEAVASANTVTPADTRARSVSKYVVLAPNPTVDSYAVEAVAADSSFVRPGDIRGRSLTKEVLIAPPLSALAQNFAMEAIGYGYDPVESSTYTLEVISGLPYSAFVSNFSVEAVAESTINPPRPQTYGVWFTITEP